LLNDYLICMQFNNFFCMRRMSLLAFLVLIIPHIIFASFAILDTLDVTQDTIHTETIEQYHLRMYKMGFDISNCRCEDCQKLKGVINTAKSKNNIYSTIRDVGIILLVCLMIVSLLLVYLIITSVINWLNGGAKFL